MFIKNNDNDITSSFFNKKISNKSFIKKSFLVFLVVKL